jgi:hypothetical protein
MLVAPGDFRFGSGGLRVVSRSAPGAFRVSSEAVPDGIRVGSR